MLINLVLSHLSNCAFEHAYVCMTILEPTQTYFSSFPSVTLVKKGLKKILGMEM